MPPKIFLTGATGYIGGDFLYAAYNAHPEWEWRCLVRSGAKGAKVSRLFPHVQLVYGHIDSIDVLEDEAAKADIVVHTAASDNHPASAAAIVKGLNRRQSSTPGYYIHTSGAYILAVESLDTGKFGERFEKVYDDWGHVSDLTSLPDHAPHRTTDKIVLGADPEKIRTAIIAPSVVFGEGRGPDKTWMASVFGAVLANQKLVMVGKGDNIWHNIHIQDLSNIYLLLAEAAATGGGVASWNDEGYYIGESGYHVMRDILYLTARLGYMKGLLPSPEVENVAPEDFSHDWPVWRVMAAVDSRGNGIRAKKLLGWKPKMSMFEDQIGVALNIEADMQGIKRQKH